MKTISILTALLFCSVSFFTSAQTPSWQWAKTSFGGTYAAANSITVNDYVYVAGGFEGYNIVIGNDTLYGDTAFSQGNSYMFLAKYDLAGNLIWLNSPSGYSSGVALASDSAGNIYLTGSFYSDSITFGNTTLTNGTYTLDNKDPDNVFVAKYDSSGKVVWAKSVATIESSNGYGINVDAAGNVYNAGLYSGTIVFAHDTLTGGGIFVVKYDAAGNEVWAKGQQQGGFIAGLSMAGDVKGNTYLTGIFQGPYIVFDKDTLRNSNINNVSNKDAMFLVKYDSSGKAGWARTAISTYSIESVGISSDSAGNVYITGSLDDTARFGNVVLNNQGLFIVKYDSAGTTIWGRISSVANGAGIGLAFANGSMYMTGWYEGSDIIVGSDTLQQGGDFSKLLVMKCDLDGNVIWAKGIKDGYYSAGTGVSVDNKDNVYMIGIISGSDIDFGPFTLSDGSLGESPDFFVAKLSNSANVEVQNIANRISPVTLYPNPTTGTIYFKGVSTGSTLSIYNILGDEIYTCTINRDNYNVNLSGKAKGMYFYRIANANESVQQGKIIIE